MFLDNPTTYVQIANFVFHSIRIRKVKCDETKPFCQRCTKTGRKCDGYLDPRALAKRRGPRDVAPFDQSLSPLLEFAAPEEQRAFWFFQNCTASCISGDFDAEFWRVIVLQISQNEPAVRHAVLAVSSLHEGLGAGFSDGALSHPQQSFALQQYNKAISRLLEQMNNSLTKPLASLLTCVMFVCIEYMQGKDKESLIHLEQGRQLLTRIDQRSNDPDMEYIVRHIVPLYTRLSLTSFLFGGSPVRIPDALKPQRDIPAIFDSFDSMRHSLHDFMEQAFQFTQSARPAKNINDSLPQGTLKLLEVEQGQLISRLAKLNVAFSLFRASRSSPSPEKSLLVLQMYLHAQHIWVSTALDSSEVVYDNFLPSFAAIVPLAAAYLDLESPSQHHPFSRPQSSSRYHFVPEQLSIAYASNFTFDTHIIPPLYYVATKCRHPLIRRSALDLLRRNPSRRENLWRASVMGALAGHIVLLEEQSSLRQRSSTSVLSTGGTSRKQANHNGDSEPILAAYRQSQDPSLYGTNTATNQTPPAVPPCTMPVRIPTLTFGASNDPSFLRDIETHSEVAHLSASIGVRDEGYSISSTIGSNTVFLDPHSGTNNWQWQQQKQEQQQQHNQQSFQPEAYSIMSSSCDTTPVIQDQSHQYTWTPSVGGSSQSGGSSEISSVDLEEQQGFDSMVQGQISSQQYQSQQGPQQHTQSTVAPIWPHAQPQSQHNLLPTNLIMEPPFGLPEEMRVHDAIIGPEREDGTWVAVFRKLHGVDEDWDVQNDWVTTA